MKLFHFGPSWSSKVDVAVFFSLLLLVKLTLSVPRGMRHSCWSPSHMSLWHKELKKINTFVHMLLVFSSVEIFTLSVGCTYGATNYEICCRSNYSPLMYQNEINSRGARLSVLYYWPVSSIRSLQIKKLMAFLKPVNDLLIRILSTSLLHYAQVQHLLLHFSSILGCYQTNCQPGLKPSTKKC